jgi:hypothetical protein
MSKKVTATAVTFAILTAATAAQAKDPYEVTADLVGNKVMYAKVIDSKATKGGVFKAEMEFLHRGGDEIEVADADGVRDVTTGGWGTQELTWQDDAGLSYQVKQYPSNNQHAPVYGEIFSGDTWVGKFRLESIKKVAPPVSGRWTGELAFPGGLSAGLSIQVARLGQKIGNDCVSYDARVHLTGLGYEEASITACKGQRGYSLGFFYFDERSPNRYYVSTQVQTTPDGNVMQGSVHMIPLTGGAGAEGKIFVSHPPVLSF